MSLTLRYLLALSLIALLSILAYLNLSVSIQAQEKSAAILNISGRQRMLTERSALYALQLQQAQQAERIRTLRDEIRSILDAMERSHRGLQRGDTQLGLPGNPPPTIEKLFTSQPHAIDERLRTYIADVRRFIDQAPSSERQQLLDSILERATGPLLVSLDRLVNQYQIESENEVARIHQLEVMTLLATLLTLLLEALLIFRPMVRQVHQKQRELQDLVASQDARIAEEVERNRAYGNHLRRLQRRLLQANRMASLSLMARTIAHHIGNPLGGIKTSLQVLGPDMPPDQRRIVERVVDKVTELGQYLKALTGAPLNAQCQSGAVGVRDCLDEVLEFLQDTLGDYQTEIRIDIPAQLQVECCEVHLQQALVNTLQNSLEELQMGPGVIDISSKPAPDGRVDICIADSGRGAPEPDRLTETFYTTKEDAAGLGLSILRNLAESLDWTLKIANRPHGGLEICLNLPAAESTATKRGTHAR